MESGARQRCGCRARKTARPPAPGSTARARPRVVPLHVSNYAVLVTDVPDLLADDAGARSDQHPVCALLRSCM